MIKGSYEEFFCTKLAQLRTQKNISARKMSLDLGFSDSYINKIENGKTLPAMDAFFHICYYLDVEPKSFFGVETVYPLLIESVVKNFSQLTVEQQKRMISIMEDTINARK